MMEVKELLLLERRDADANVIRDGDGSKGTTTISSSSSSSSSGSKNSKNSSSSSLMNLVVGTVRGVIHTHAVVHAHATGHVHVDHGNHGHYYVDTHHHHHHSDFYDLEVGSLASLGSSAAYAGMLGEFIAELGALRVADAEASMAAITLLRHFHYKHTHHYGGHHNGSSSSSSSSSSDARRRGSRGGNGENGGWGFFAVYDGHSGDQVGTRGSNVYLYGSQVGGPSAF